MKTQERVWGEATSAVGVLLVADSLAGACAQVESLGAALERPELVASGQLRPLLAGLGQLGARVEAMVLRVATEAAARGLHTEGGFRLPDWVALACPGLSGQQVGDITLLARAVSTDLVHATVVDVVLAGQVSLTRAARVIRAADRVRPVLPADEYAAAVALLMDTAADARFDDRDLKKVTDRLILTCLSRREQAERDRARHAARGVHHSSLGDGTLRRVIITFGDEADYEAVTAILTSPLAAPATSTERETIGSGRVGETEQLDLRTVSQRRYDALLTVLRRGVAGTRGQPTTPKAQLVVTMSLETLTCQLAGLPNTKAGVGTTGTGGALTAGVVRRLACEAEIIPVVLGTNGEILDQGRAKRLVTPGQRLFLAHRDGGCTFPGCHTPATWCDAHHVIHWVHGGRSDVGNYALLCPRHHTWVHVHGATATVTAFGVTWHL